MVSMLTGVVREGRVEFDSPAALPEGTRVRVEPAPNDGGFLREEDWPTTPEAIAEHARKMVNFDPVILTDEDRAKIASARAAYREFELAATRKTLGFEP